MTTLGELILELKLDDVKFADQLERNRQKAVSIGREIEQKLHLSILTVKVDDSALTKLNQHYDLKVKHQGQVQNFFNAKPLKPKVDFSNLDRVEKQLNRIKNGRYSPSISTPPASTGSTSTGSAGRSDAQQLANAIGQSVARHSRQGIASRAMGAVGSVLATPGKIVGRSIAGVAEGLMFGATQEVSRNLGKGLSNALEKQISKSLGSSELVGERVGGALALSVLQSFQGKLSKIPEVLEQAIDKIESPKARAELKKKLEAAKELPDVLQEQVITTLGGAQEITEEGLYQRGLRKQKVRERRPVAQEQALQEWRQAVKDEDRIAPRAQMAVQESQQQLAQLLPKLRVAAQNQQVVGTQLKEARDAGATPEELEPLMAQLREATAVLEGLNSVAEGLRQREAIAQRALTEGKANRSKTFRRYESVRSKQQPKAYLDLLREATGRELSEDERPELIVNDQLLKQSGSAMFYQPAKNQIVLSSATMKALQAEQVDTTIGDLGLVAKDSQLASRKLREALLEEIEHAVDADFGSVQGVEAARSKRTVQPLIEVSTEEGLQFAEELSHYAPEDRAYELNAKAKARRTAERLERQKQQRDALIYHAPFFTGTNSAIDSKRLEFAQSIQSAQRLARVADVDISQSIAVLQQLFEKTADGIQQLANESLANLENLEPTELEGNAQTIQAKWGKGFGLIDGKLNDVQVRQIDEIQRLGRGDMGLGMAYKPHPDFVPSLPETPEAWLDSNLDVWTDPPKEVTAIAKPAPAPPAKLSPTDRARALGEKAGQFTRGTIQAAQAGIEIAQQAIATTQKVSANITAIMQQTPVQPFVQGVANAAYAAGAVAGTFYKVAQGVEAFALDMAPMGRTAKGVLQQTVLPGAAFMAASHFLPGGEVVANGLTHLAQGAMNPLMESAIGSLSGQATNFIHAALPNIMGIQSAATGAVTGAIDSVVTAAGNVIVQAGTAIVGGKVLQSAAAVPLKSALPGANVKALPPVSQQALPAVSQQPIEIPAKTHQKELVEVEMVSAPQPERKALPLVPGTPSNSKPASITSSDKSSDTSLSAIEPVKSKIESRQTPQVQQVKSTHAVVNQAAYKAGEVTRQVVDSIGMTAQAAIEEAQKLETGFSKLYQGLQSAIKEGNHDLVSQYSQAMQNWQENSYSIIDELIQQAKDTGAGLGSEALTKLGGIKGRLTQRFNLSQKTVRKYEKERQERGDDLTQQMKSLNQIDPDQGIADIKHSMENALNALKQLANHISQQAKTAIANHYEIEPEETLAETVNSAAATEKGQAHKNLAKDLIVNTAGFAAGSMAQQHGPLPEMVADLIAALTARQVVNAGEAGVNALQQLQEDEVFKAANALEKFLLVLQKIPQLLQNSDFQNLQGEELFSDLTGFAVGNLVKELPRSIAPGLPGMDVLAQIPGRGAVAAMAAVPQLKNLRDHIQGRLQTDRDAEERGEGLEAHMLNFETKGLKQTKRMTTEQKVMLEEVLGILNRAIDSADKADAAAKQLNQTTNEQFNQSIAGVEQALNPDYTDLLEHVQKNMDEYEQAVKDLNQGYGDRFKASQDELQEMLEIWEEYQNLTAESAGGKDEGEFALVPPTPPKQQKAGWMDALTGDLGDLKTKAIAAASGLGALAILKQVADWYDQVREALMQAAMEMQRFERSLAFTSSASKAQATLKGLREDAKNLGIDLRQSIAGQAQLQAAAQGTSLEGESMKQMGSALRQAGAVYGMDGQAQERTFLATSQIISKGKLSAEEIRQQMGEALPGAFQIAARSMGVTTAELDKMLQRGEVLAEDFIPKFAAQLSAETSSGLAGASNSAQASINRFNNAMYEMQVAVGAGLLPLEKAKFDVMTAGLNLVQNSFGLIAQILSGVILGAIAKYTMQLALNSKGAIANALAQLTLKGALSGVGQGFAFAGNAAKKFFGQSANSTMGWTIAMIAVLDLIKMTSSAFEDGGGATREFADQSKQSFEEYLKLVGRAKEKTDDWAESLKSIKTPSLMEETLPGKAMQLLLGKETGQGVSRAFERSIQGEGPLSAIAYANPVTLAAMAVNASRGGGFRLATNAEKKTNDLSIAAGDALTQNNLTVQEVHRMIGTDGKAVAGRELDTYLKDQEQLRDIQARRRALLPGDLAGRRSLDTQETEVLQRLETSSKPVATLRSQLASELEGLKKTKEQITEEISKLESTPNLTAGEQEALKRLKGDLANTEFALQDTQTQMDRLGKATGGMVDAVGRLSRAFAEVQGELERTNMMLDRSAAMTRKNIALQLQFGGLNRNGLSREQAGYLRSLSEQEILLKRIEARQKSVRDSQNLLTGVKVQEALQSVGITSIEDINPTELRSRIEPMEENEQKKLLAQAADARQNINEGITEVANMEAQLEEAKADLIQQLRDLNKSIEEYFRDVTRNAEEMARSTKQMQLDTQVTRAKTELQRGLNRFSDNFFGELVDQILNVVDLLYQIPRNGLEAEQQIAQLRYGLEDRERQGNALARQMPGTVGAGGGMAGGGAGGAIASGLYTGPSANIGGSAEYHIDSKFSRSLGWDKITDLFDQMAQAYQAQGRVIEFSNNAVSGKRYDLTMSREERMALLKDAIGAHHSQERDASKGVYSVDYYVPKTGEDRYGSSVEGAEIMLPSVAGAKLEYGSGGGYGNYVYMIDAQGNTIMATGHGDDRRNLPQNRTLSAAPAQPAAQSTPSVGTGGGGRSIRTTRSGQSDQYGNELLNVELIENGQVVDRVQAVSGRPGRQNFRTMAQSQSGSNEPLPEGTYSLGAPETDANSWGNDALGGMWIGIDPNQSTERSALGIHVDGDRTAKPGTEGCIGFIRIEDGRKVSEWVANGANQMVVDWNLGTLPQSARAQAQPQTQQVAQPSRSTQPAASSGGSGLSLDQVFGGGSQSLASRIVGMSEGTRVAGGGTTAGYDGHSDPGNRAHNIGSFSYQAHQGGASTPEEADALWNGRLREQMPKYQAAAQRAGLNPNDPQLLFNFLDLYTQSPLAATGRGGFLDQFGSIAKQGISADSILRARVQSYHDPDSGRLDAPGLGNTVDEVTRDQTRRMGEVQAGIAHYGVAGGGSAGPAIGAIDSSSSMGGMMGQVSAEGLAQINQGAAMSRQAVDAQTAAIRERAATLDAQARMQVEQALGQIDRQVQQTERELQDNTRTEERRQQDQELDAQVQTPQVQYQRQRLQVERGYEDSTRQLSLNIERFGNSISDLSKLRENLSSMNDPRLQPTIEAIDQAIATAQTEQKKNEELLKRETEVRDKQLTHLESEFHREEEARRIASEQMLTDAQGQRSQAMTQQAQAQIEAYRGQAEGLRGQAEDARRRGDGLGAIDLEMQANASEGMAIGQEREMRLAEMEQRRSQIEMDYKSKLHDAQRQLTDGQIDQASFDQFKQSLEEAKHISLENLGKDLANIEANADRSTAALERQNEQLRYSREQLIFNSRNQVFDTEMNVANAIAQGYQTRGYGAQAQDVEKQIKTAQANMDLQRGLRQIDEAVRSGNLLADAAASARSNLMKLNEIQLDNIEAEFNLLTPVMGAFQSSTEGFFSGLLDGTKSLEEALQGFLQSLLDSLSKLAAQLITDELLGGLFGIKRGGVEGMFGGSGISDQTGRSNDVFSNVLGMPLPGMGGTGMGAIAPQFAPQQAQNNIVPFRPPTSQLDLNGFGLMPLEELLPQSPANSAVNSAAIEPSTSQLDLDGFGLMQPSELLPQALTAQQLGADEFGLAALEGLLPQGEQAIDATTGLAQSVGQLSIDDLALGEMTALPELTELTGEMAIDDKGLSSISLGGKNLGEKLTLPKELTTLEFTKGNLPKDLGLPSIDKGKSGKSKLLKGFEGSEFAAIEEKSDLPKFAKQPAEKKSVLPKFLKRPSGEKPMLPKLLGEPSIEGQAKGQAWQKLLEKAPNPEKLLPPKLLGKYAVGDKGALSLLEKSIEDKQNPWSALVDKTSNESKLVPLEAIGSSTAGLASSFVGGSGFNLSSGTPIATGMQGFGASPAIAQTGLTGASGLPAAGLTGEAGTTFGPGTAINFYAQGVVNFHCEGMGAKPEPLSQPMSAIDGQPMMSEAGGGSLPLTGVEFSREAGLAPSFLNADSFAVNAATPLPLMAEGGIGNAMQSLLGGLAPGVTEFGGGLQSLLEGAIAPVQGGFGSGVMSLLGGMGAAPAQGGGSGGILSLFSGLLGGGGGVASMGLGLLSSLFGGSGGGLLNFSDGGPVPMVPHHREYAKGQGAIAEAMKREGSNAVLAALTPGEKVLTVAQAKRYDEMQIDQVLNFKKGGTVPGAAIATPKLQAGGGGVSVSAPVTVNTSNADSVDVPAFQRVINTQIQEAILRESRPGGTLHRR